MSSAAGNLAIAERRRFPRGRLMVVPDETTWRTLVVFCLYRVILAAFVGGAFIFLNRFFNLGIVTPGAVVPTVVSYTLASVLLLTAVRESHEMGSEDALVDLGARGAVRLEAAAVEAELACSEA